LADTPRTNDLGQPIGWPLETELPRPRPERVTLEGRYCTLRPLASEDGPGLWDAFSEDKTGAGWTYLPHGPFATEADFRGFIDSAAQSEDPLFFTVLMDGRPAGHATLLRIDEAQGVIEVGFIHFSPLIQRTPASTEAMFLLMAYVFDDLGYRRYEWKCDALNAPSRKSARRLGFTYEGTFRQATSYKGRNRDTAWFSILNSEWPVLKARFERWLDPSNFDASGNQKSSL